MSFLTGIIASTVLDTTFSFLGNKVKQKAYAAQADQAISAANENRRIALFAGQAEADRIRRRGKIIQGMDIAKTAGSGISMTGSALDIIAQNIHTSEIDASTALYNANLKGNAYMREGMNSAYQYANAQAALPLETMTHTASSIFAGYSLNRQNDMAELSLRADLDAAKALSNNKLYNSDRLNKKLYGEDYGYRNEFVWDSSDGPTVGDFYSNDYYSS